MTLLNSKQCLRVVATVVLSFQAEQYFKVVEFQAGSLRNWLDWQANPKGLPGLIFLINVFYVFFFMKPLSSLRS